MFHQNFMFPPTGEQVPRAPLLDARKPFSLYAGGPAGGTSVPPLRMAPLVFSLYSGGPGCGGTSAPPPPPAPLPPSLSESLSPSICSPSLSAPVLSQDAGDQLDRTPNVCNHEDAETLCLSDREEGGDGHRVSLSPPRPRPSIREGRPPASVAGEWSFLVPTPDLATGRVGAPRAGRAYAHHVDIYVDDLPLVRLGLLSMMAAHNRDQAHRYRPLGAAAHFRDAASGRTLVVHMLTAGPRVSKFNQLYRRAGAVAVPYSLGARAKVETAVELTVSGAGPAPRSVRLVCARRTQESPPRQLVLLGPGAGPYARTRAAMTGLHIAAAAQLADKARAGQTRDRATGMFQKRKRNKRPSGR